VKRLTQTVLVLSQAMLRIYHTTISKHFKHTCQIAHVRL
ncbi:aminotransferase class-III family protein, partial [Vibrio parahaemolyticus V-223/04]